MREKNVENLEKKLSDKNDPKAGYRGPQVRNIFKHNYRIHSVKKWGIDETYVRRTTQLAKLTVNYLISRSHTADS